jgi:hypothetical protein
MLHTVLRRRANGETVEQIQPDLIIPTGRRKGQNPSPSSIYRALAEQEKRATYTVSYVVVGRWSSHGEGYVELDCAGRAVGDREAADPAVEGAAAGRWNAGHT